jgi:hypothetical protein
VDVDGFVDEGWPLAGVAWPDPSAEPFEFDDVFPMLLSGRRQGVYCKSALYSAQRDVREIVLT